MNKYIYKEKNNEEDKETGCSLMAVTAAAYGAEEHDETCCEESIQPRKPAAPVCPYCGTVTTDMGFVWEGGTRYIKFQCLGCRDFTTRVRY